MSLDKQNGLLKRTILAVSVFMFIFQAYTAATAPLQPMEQRALHLGFALVLLFLYTIQDHRKLSGRIFYCIIALAGMAVNLYIFFDWQKMSLRTPTLLPIDYVMGIITIGIILIAAYHAVGIWMPMITLIVIGYIFIGPEVSGQLHFQNISSARFLSSLYFGTDGIYGACSGISATYVFMFIMYGECLLKYGAGDFFISVSKKLFCHRKNASAKISVFSSLLFGMLSVSPNANISGTGYLTIPMMKREGYSSEYSSGLVAASAVGGNFTPPVLGVVALMMASMLHISYGKLCLITLLPAVLYYCGLFFIAFNRQKKEKKYKQISIKTDGKNLLAQGWHYLLSIAVLLGQLFFLPWSPARAALIALLTLFAGDFLQKVIKERTVRLKETLSRLSVALEDGCEKAIPISVATACTGIIFGVFYATGLNLRFSALMIGLAGGSQVMLLIFTMIGTLILGMRMPEIAAYIIMSNLMVPCLIAVGINNTAAYMFIFYLVVMASIIPIVGGSACVAASVGQAKPLNTGLYAVAAALPGYILPFIFVYSPAILFDGSPLEIAFTFCSILIGIFALLCGSDGYMNGYKLKSIKRVSLIAAGIAVIVCRSPVVVLGIIIFMILILTARYVRLMGNNKLL